MKDITGYKIDIRQMSLLSLILILTFLIRIPFLAEPFESDQAVYSYVARSWQQGKIPYKDVFDNKPPAIYLFLRLVMNFFGSSVKGIHLAYAILAVFSTFLFYGLSRLFFTDKIALLSTFLYGLFSGSTLISGSFANIENLAIFFIILAFYIFWTAYKEERKFLFFLSGIFIGLAIISKQTALYEGLAISVFLFWIGLCDGKFFLNLKRIALIWLGAILVVFSFLFYFALKGAIKDFFASVFVFNLFFSRIVGIRQGLVNLWNALFWTPRENFLLWLLAGFGLMRAIQKKEDGKCKFLLLWFGASILGMASSLRFYHHYFIQIIPILVLLAAFYLSEIFLNKPVLWKRVLGTGLVILTIALFMRIQWRYYFQYSPVESLINRRGNLARPQLYKATPQMSKFIKKKTKPDDYIYVWGLWPEIYFYSQRQSSSKYFFLAARGIMLGEFAKRVHQQVLADTMRNKPKYFIIDYHFANSLSPALAEYLKNNYSLETEIAGCQILHRND